MNLQFFRKHRKIFFVLMILAVFAMVTFGALDQLQQIFTRFRGDPAAKEIVMTIHGQDISRARYNEVQAYMHHVARQSDLQQWILSLLFHAETIGSRFGGGTGREGSATKAALILLVEAEQAGVALDEQLAEAQFDQLSPEDRSLLLRIFGGSREQTLIAARLEFTLQRYLDKVGEGAKILPEDVDEYFRRMYQTARITEVTVPSAKFVDQVGEPAAEAVQQQFDRYRDQLPEQSSEGFGYMVPDRVMIEWIYMDAEEVAATVKVTDTEIQAFYEENRESYVREPAAAPAGEAATPADAGATEAAPPATAPVEEPARQMNAPDAPATPAADGAAGENADNAPAAAPVAANQPEAIIQSENNQTQPPPAPPAPPKEYKPLEEVREQVIKDLRNHRAVVIINEKMERAMRTLERAPAGLDLRLVAGDPEEDEEPLMHIASTERPVSFDDARQLPGIGGSFQIRQGQQIPFAALVLSVEPLQQGSGVFQNRPIGPFFEPDGSKYIARVTRVEPAREPQSIDEVRDRVVADIKRIEAQKLANARAEELVNQARERNVPLATLAEEAVMDVRTDVNIRLGRAGVDSFEQLVMNAFDQNTRFGTYRTSDYGRVIAFEVTGGDHVPQNLYDTMRSFVAQQMLDAARTEMKRQALGLMIQLFQGQPIPVGIDIESLERRSNMQVHESFRRGTQIEAPAE